MCHLFATQSPDSYAFETRSIRLNGQSTSHPPRESVLGNPRGDRRGRRNDLPRFISTLHHEVVLLRGEVPNFTSHLRCICVVAIETRRVRGKTERAEAA